MSGINLVSDGDMEKGGDPEIIELEDNYDDDKVIGNI